MSNALVHMLNTFSDRYGMGVKPESVAHTLKSTCFKGPVTDAQMLVLLIVADQYKLNPFTKELYAFPDKNNGMVPVVGVDGWARIINDNPAFDGMDFVMDKDFTACTCRIYRKDRSLPIIATEYMDECKRNTPPWLSHPRRMLRHKAMIQCARIAFGFAGIYDQDEAERIDEAKDERIVERDVTKLRAADYAKEGRSGADTEEIMSILDRLQAIADSGDFNALTDAWKGLTSEQRNGVGKDRWPKIKADALASSEKIKASMVIDGKAQEVAE